MNIYVQVFNNGVASGTTGNYTAITGATYIGVFDADTGAPTDGNGLQVTYQPLYNGVPGAVQTVNIIGQSYKVDAGIISITDNTTGEVVQSFSVAILSYPTSVPEEPPVPPATCDADISSVTVIKESAHGAGDGQATINATSSHGPITYSLDNVTFQSSPIFAGLVGGLYTAYIKDGNACTDSLPFTVSVVSGLLVSDPTIDMGNGNVSRWSAAFNPINFIYQRKDFEVTKVDGFAIVNAGTYAQVYINGDMSSVLVGDLIYLKAGPYNGVYEVLQKGNTPGKFILDTSFLTNGTGFININRLRPNYLIQTKIKYVDPATGSFNTITSTNRPDNKGLVKADISSFLQSILRVKDGSNYSVLNYRDSDLSASYQISYAETWLGSDVKFTDIAAPYYVVYSAKQLGEAYGGNLGAYVPFPTVNSTDKLAKWVTDFKEPVYSNGQPFDIGFIYGEELAGYQLYFKIKQLDINRAQLNLNNITSFLLNENGTFLLNQDGTKLVIARQDLFNTPIVEHVGLNRLLINTQFGDEVYYFKVALYYDNDSTEVQVTEEQTIRIDKEIQLRSVYLRWIGLTGCWNYYRFYYNQEMSLDVANATIIKNYIVDWEAEDTIEDVINKKANQKMKLSTVDTAVGDIKGLQSIKYSPKVQMLVGTNPVRWQTVVLASASFDEYETVNRQAPFSITINLPSINVQTQ